MPPGWTMMVRNALELAGDMGVVGLALDNGERDAVRLAVEDHIARLRHHLDEQQCRREHGGADAKYSDPIPAVAAVAGEHPMPPRRGPGAAAVDDAASLFADLEDRTPLADTPAVAEPSRDMGEWDVMVETTCNDSPCTWCGGHDAADCDCACHRRAIERSDGGREKP